MAIEDEQIVNDGRWTMDDLARHTSGLVFDLPPTVYRLVLIALNLLAIAGLAAIGPAERTLGVNVRVVYLHGAWVWAALAMIWGAAAAGLYGLAARAPAWQAWSRALGRSGLVFWVTYLPLSLWAMQANWNGLFLAEPRWRLAAIFAVAGLLLQAGLALMEDLRWTAFMNCLYGVALAAVLRATPNVMHPPAPILNSDAWRIQGFFAVLSLLTLLAAAQVAMWFYIAPRSQHNTARVEIPPI